MICANASYNRYKLYISACNNVMLVLWSYFLTFLSVCLSWIIPSCCWKNRHSMLGKNQSFISQQFHKILLCSNNTLLDNLKTLNLWAILSLQIITSMVFAIIAAVFCIPVLILSAIGQCFCHLLPPAFRRNGEGNVFTGVCPSTPMRGYPHLANWGGYPIPGYPHTSRMAYPPVSRTW